MLPAGLLTSLIGPVADMGKTLIERIFPDKEKQAAERAQAEIAMATLIQEGKIKEMATSMSAILAEAQSADPWTSRARPMFLYVMYIMILSAIPMGVLYAFRPDIALAVAHGAKAWLDAIPEEMWWLFGAGYLGYAGVRMVEKGKGAAK
jgi:hypothetical protein